MCNEEIIKHMEEDMTFRGLSERTQKSYIWRVSRYMKFHEGKDSDSENMRILVWEWKESKYRYTLLSQTNLDILREYFKVYRPKHKENYLLPPRFIKIRHFGLLGNRNKTKKLIYS